MTDPILAFAFDSVEQWIAAGGYFMLFGLLFLCGLGLPLPEDIPLMIAGALVANGKFHLAIAAVAAWCGIIGGDIVLYHLGKKFGLEITRLPFIGKHLTKARIEKVEVMFGKYGIWVVAIGRMFAGIRGAMVVAAGAIRYNFWKFLIADGIAAIVSGGLFVFIGHWLGSRLKEHMEDIDKYKFRVGIGVGVAVVGLILFFVWKSKREKGHGAEDAGASESAPAASNPHPSPSASREYTGTQEHRAREEERAGN
jgi:membrane protein DedA with SNARE-associated domain